MNYVIKNGILTVEISNLGAELMSVKKDGIEYIWQGNSSYWKGRAYNLFPSCGRMFDGKYKYKGNLYELKIHGIVRYSECFVCEHSNEKIVFCLKSNPDTEKIYPFKFNYYAEFTLNGNKLNVKYTAKNTGENEMYCTFGGHPGFNVPLDNGDFDDYYLEFTEKCNPREMLFDDGTSVEYALRDNKYIDLKHSMFDNDSVFLINAASSVMLKSKKSKHSVTVTYPDMKYIGFWHVPKTDAPYVCIEPWCGSPAKRGEYSDIENMQDMFKIEKGGFKSVGFEMIFE